jgi:hypothetical protein
VALSSTPEMVALAYWMIPSVGGDVEDCTGGRGSARRYRPLLESVDGSALSNHD